ncbi:MAG: hypothetical protein QNJ63_26240 [Calothrix sp. MO_192.B10]|nr:hypothetical protein [Calothrix sp. MO_192.B10]
MAILQNAAGGNPVQHIYGGITPDGSTMFGEGFRSHKLRYGLYLIEFDKPFAKNPAAVCTIYGNEWETFNKSIAIPEVSPWHLVCTTSSPDRPVDSGFTFIAFGDL